MRIETTTADGPGHGRAPVLAAKASTPAWVGELERDRFRTISLSFDDVLSMDILTFQQRIVETYLSVFEQLESTELSHAVRFWAFVPGIHDALGAGLDRYMAFNAGRYGAFALRYGRSTGFSRSVPTASAVGIQDDRFVLHCLASDEPGLPVENPRQTSAYHYSKRYGPIPPCFARATLVRGHAAETLLMVGGTASITGEESRHIGDIEGQVTEIFRNLASVTASAGGRMISEQASLAGLAELKPLLTAFRDVRVYFANAAHQPRLAALLGQVFPPDCRVEWHPASLCRAELLVEIEGVATLSARGA